MNVDAVRRVLEEVFPQVDSRMLKAVALEHCKDDGVPFDVSLDVAVDVVLKEIIPNLSEQSQSLVASSSSNTKSSLNSSEVVDRGRAGKGKSSLDSADGILGLHKLLSEAGPSSINASLPVATQVSESFGKFLYHDVNDADVVGIAGNEEDEPIDLIRKRLSYDKNDQENVKIMGENVELLADSKVIDAEVSGSVHDEVNHHMDVSEIEIEAEDNYIHLNVDTLKFIDSTNNESDLNYSSKSASEKDAFTIEDVSMENESTVIDKNEKCSAELLDESIEDVRDKKKVLSLTMNSVVDLMREVEQKEKVAEQIKEQANRDCSDIYSKVDEIKQTLQLAKEANDMHAGEVYGERAILATEYKELQHRLFTFSDRNKSLEILIEMQKSLEIRLATTLEQIALAEEEKVNKVMAAREVLSYEQQKMEEVVEESKKLMLEAEENTKLQEIIMDRGQIVDILLGEYAVIDQDVLLLKEKFEKRIPLSRSLSSSQTSSVLASTNSSFQSTATVTPPGFESPKKHTELADSYGFLDNSSRLEIAESPKSPINTGAFYLSRQEKLDNSSSSDVAESPKSAINAGAYFLSGEEKEKRIADRKKLLEDGWELFENGDLLGC